MAQFVAKATAIKEAYKIGTGPVPAWMQDAIHRDLALPVFTANSFTVQGYNIRKRGQNEYAAKGDYVTNTSALTDDADIANVLDVFPAAEFEALYAADPAGLTTVLTKADLTPDSTVGDAATNPIIWAIAVANATDTLALADIAVSTNATKKLYSNSAFSTEITGENTLALTAGAVTAAYIKVTSQATTNVKYYKVNITRAAGE